MRLSRQEYWMGCHPGNLPNPGIEPRSLMSPALASKFLTTSAIRKARHTDTHMNTQVCAVRTSISSFKKKTASQRGKHEPLITLNHFMESSWAASKSKNILWTLSPMLIFSTFHPFCYMFQYFGHLMWRELTHLKRPWFWERLRAGGEEEDRGWDGWMASLTRWTWVWVNSGRWCWTGRPGVLRFMGSQRVGHDWATELNWTLVIDWFRLKNMISLKTPWVSQIK